MIGVREDDQILSYKCRLQLVASTRLPRPLSPPTLMELDQLPTNWQSGTQKNVV